MNEYVHLKGREFHLYLFIYLFISHVKAKARIFGFIIKMSMPTHGNHLNKLLRPIVETIIITCIPYDGPNGSLFIPILLHNSEF